MWIRTTLATKRNEDVTVFSVLGEHTVTNVSSFFVELLLVNQHGLKYGKNLGKIQQKLLRKANTKLFYNEKVYVFLAFK